MSPGGQQNPAQLNALARAAIKARAVKMEQQVFSQTFTPAAGQNVSQLQPVITVNPRFVGLILGFYVKVVATINNQSGVTIDLTDFGPANLFSQIQFNDLNNNTRIQTTGWHMNLLNTVKARQPYGAALVRTTGTDSPVNYGSNWQGQNSAPQQILAGNSGTVTFWFYVPLAYSENDLRGAVYANIVNATMQLNLTPNPTPVVANATDSTSAMYVGHAAGSVAAAVMSAMTVTVYQCYLDQLPVGNAGVILPILDLATIYEMKNTTFSSLVANNDFPMQYANFRDFLSTFAIYNNNPANNSGRQVGQDINYWALQSANFTNILKREPALVALEEARQVIQDDLPPGTYYFSTRQKPISTVQYGNMQLVLNALTVNPGAYVLVGYEDFALVQTLSMAGSLAAS